MAVLLFTGNVALAAEAKKPAPKVPLAFDFKKSLHLELFTHVAPDIRDAQGFRAKTRYLDPDVNAFVGLITNLYRFDEKLRLESSGRVDPVRSHLLWNWGINLGIKRGRSWWEVDLMGAVLNRSLAPVLGLAGDHALSRRFEFYHRTEVSFFAKDMLLDSDQGIRWMYDSVGITVGYRIFSGNKMNHNGPRVGVTYRFESPKIPFLFPSLG